MKKYFFSIIAFIFFFLAILTAGYFFYSNSVSSDASIVTTNQAYAIGENQIEEIKLAQIQTERTLEIDSLAITVTESTGRTVVDAHQSVSFTYTLINRGNADINSINFTSIFDQSRLKFSNDIVNSGLNVFFDLEETDTGKTAIIDEEFNKIIGSIAPGETKSFNVNFVSLRKATPTCINTTIEYQSDEINAFGTSTYSECITIREISLNTDF